MQVSKNPIKNRMLALWATAALFSSSTLIPQDTANKERDIVPTLAFGIDRADNLVIQDISRQGHTSPIVGDPTCLQFVQPCPHASDKTSKSVTGSDSSFGVPSGQEPKSSADKSNLDNLDIGKKNNAVNSDNPFSIPTGQGSNGTNNTDSFNFPTSQEHEKANGDSSFSLPVSQEPAYKIEFEAKSPKDALSLPLKVSGGGGDSLRIVKPEDWNLTLKGYRPRKKQWDVVIEPQGKKKDTSSAGGCWIEVSCPSSKGS
jgi:hypothetical protein